ncbi:MAG: hypothetical protein WBA74_23640 [Cyclobacteriaceae bacterium]
MKTFKILALLICLTEGALAMPNCYVYKEDEKCFEACKEAEKAVYHPQGSKASQEHFMKSVALCPEFAFSFYEMAVPFAKRGQMHLYIDMIDKAVAVEPETYLAQRGWYHWFFMHNYEKAIEDIDRLDALVEYDIGETGDGFYHLNVMKGLCYKGLGEYEKAIELIVDCMADEEYYERSYDHLHLGVLYLDTNRPEKALEEFEKQIAVNEISEAYFYSAKAHEVLGNVEKVAENYRVALEKYDQRKAMHNPYRQLVDKIYRLDIEEALEALSDE